MTVAIDASAVVAGLLDDGLAGRWAEAVLLSEALAAPHLMPVEVASILRRSAAAGIISAGRATEAHAHLLALRVELFPYEPLARRVWELRHNVTPYDAWYVALAEAIDAPLATLDQRLAQATGTRCRFETPEVTL
ncbi:MAG: type II toxin-antitoxin system VapC family toxin [Actinomycetota bacterium]